MKSLALLIAASSLAVAADFPRPAELTFPLATGQKINLADHRGKVVALEFLLTTCPGCQRASRVLNDMQAAYGPKGFQVLGVAINPGAQLLVGEYVSRFGLSTTVL